MKCQEYFANLGNGSRCHLYRGALSVLATGVAVPSSREMACGVSALVTLQFPWGDVHASRGFVHWCVPASEDGWMVGVALINLEKGLWLALKRASGTASLPLCDMTPAWMGKP